MSLFYSEVKWSTKRKRYNKGHCLWSSFDLKNKERRENNYQDQRWSEQRYQPPSVCFNEKQKSIGCWAEGATASEKSQEEEDLSQAVYLIL